MRRTQYEKNVAYRNYINKIKYQSAGQKTDEVVGKDPKTGDPMYRSSDGRLYTINSNGEKDYGQNANTDNVGDDQSSYAPVDPNNPEGPQYGVSKNYQKVEEENVKTEEELTQGEENEIFIETIKEFYKVKDDDIITKDNKIIIRSPMGDVDPTTNEEFNTQLEHNKDVYKQQKNVNKEKNTSTSTEDINQQNINAKKEEAPKEEALATTNVTNTENPTNNATNTNNNSTNNNTNIQVENTTGQSNISTIKEEKTQVNSQVNNLQPKKDNITVDGSQSITSPSQLKDAPEPTQYTQPINNTEATIEEESKHRSTFRERLAERRQKREERRLGIELAPNQPNDNTDNTSDSSSQSGTATFVDIKRGDFDGNKFYMDYRYPYTYPPDIDPKNINKDENGDFDGTYMDKDGNRVATREKRKEIEKQAEVNAEKNIHTSEEEGKDTPFNSRTMKYKEEPVEEQKTEPKKEDELPYSSRVKSLPGSEYKTDNVQEMEEFTTIDEKPEELKRIDERRADAKEKIQREIEKLDDPKADIKDVNLNVMIARLEQYFGAEADVRFAKPIVNDPNTMSDYDKKNQNRLNKSSSMARSDASYNIDRITPGYNPYNSIASKRTTHKVLKDFDALNHMGRLFKRPSRSDKEVAYNIMNDYATSKGWWLEDLKKEARPLDKMRINRIKRREKRFERKLEKEDK